jgi:hypothetical protein
MELNSRTCVGGAGGRNKRIFRGFRHVAVCLRWEAMALEYDRILNVIEGLVLKCVQGNCNHKQGGDLGYSCHKSWGRCQVPLTHHG